MREQRRVDDLKQRAAELEERRAQGKGFNIPIGVKRDDEGKLKLRGYDLARLNPMARVRGHNYAVQQSEQAEFDRTKAQQLGVDLAEQGTALGRAKLAQEKRQAKERGLSLDDHRTTRAAYEMAQNVGDEEVAGLQRLIGAGMAPAPTLGQRPQVSPLPPPPGSVASGEGTDADVNRTLANEGNMDHQMNTESIQSELGSQGDEGGEQQGQQGQKPPEELQRNPDAFKNITRFAQGG
jgi:hypothetical protein